MEAKIVPIGNSKGIRIPKRLLVKYGLDESVEIKETENGILLRKEENSQLSWADTYQEMAKEDEDWTDWADLDVGDME